MTSNELASIACRIIQQADCLDHYAEMSGFKAGPIPSVFHLQSSHFRDLGEELRRAADRYSENATGAA